MEIEREETAEVETPMRVSKKTVGAQQKRGVTERATVPTEGGKRRESETGASMEVASDGRQPDWLPYVPLTWRQLQRKTWFLTIFFPDRDWTEERVKEAIQK